ncbi:Oidioi.mRNA.OKI2018_I69.XSR.g14936.t2.cds [Oikopleura dioica]|uniref:Ubiquitin carboxyl-terminal hydrolase n=1 Tax=Oikopleura dioica TaxID=34765 RepID=A0ABN7SHJ9_OIKDI|nr:Oidioi.mRNA.OKI2018_I69.XSR.g14936.t2.cds [Oikopleura dioica]
MEEYLPQSIFSVKACSKKPKDLRIITQCNNGPCPIIALLNCLIVQGRIEQPSPSSVTAEEMMTQLGNFILNQNIPDENKELLLHAQSTSLEVCSSQQLLTGLDINLKYRAVDAFEYTPMIELFDFLNIKLFHCWVPSREDDEYEELSKVSYNELVLLLFDAEKQKLKEWFTQTGSQATEYGIFEMKSKMKPGEVAILFRNNHFFVVTRQEDTIFSLITDQGYLHSPDLVWEEVTVSCDGKNVNADFLSKEELIEDDAKLAKQLQERERFNQNQQARVPRQAKAQKQRDRNAQKAPKNSKDKDSGCKIM